jgi:hypothetical protein
MLDVLGKEYSDYAASLSLSSDCQGGLKGFKAWAMYIFLKPL